ncbi:MAG TPA: nucleotide exchange factor GrpE [Candidatus Acidoferrum sp.]|nr:nucleotide exchange factor GrpE [Candidatus Acidoferrum sp.]
MPRRTRAEERIADIDISPTRLLAELERVTAERDAALAQAEEYLGGLQRERAEFVNYKRRNEQEGAAAASRHADSLRLKVLDTLDDFDRAIEARPAALEADPWAEGIAAIDRKLRALLEREGVRPMETTVGHPFDPRLHQAISHVSGSGRPADEIVGEFARGYLVADRVLRPALVAVSDGDDGTDAVGSDDEESSRLEGTSPSGGHFTN